MKATYIPARGDIVWIDFDPTKGHEQKGRRPAIVISSEKYNAISGRALVCPITSKSKGYAFEVVYKGQHIQGAILADQVRTLDFRERNVIFIEQVSPGVVAMVGERIAAIVFD